MTHLPALSVTSDAVIVTLDNGSVLVLRTPTAARAHGDLLRSAEQHLAEMERDRATRLDREVGALMNLQAEAEHEAWGSVLQGWPPVPAAPRVGERGPEVIVTDPFPLIRACGCARYERCPVCTDAA